MNGVVIRACGDSAISVEFEKKISPIVNRKVYALDAAVKNAHMAEIIETVPTYCSLIIHYRPEIIGLEKIKYLVESLVKAMDAHNMDKSIVYEIPVLYGGKEGPDLQDVADFCGKTPEEVIQIHSRNEYLIYMLGFTPGFPYLGGMDKSIAVPRLKSPRTSIPEGSVGIAGEQTGIYPLASPGGWRIIGQTPVRLFDAAREDAVLLEAGSFIKFTPISKEEFTRIKRLVNEGSYRCSTYIKEVHYGN